MWLQYLAGYPLFDGKRNSFVHFERNCRLASTAGGNRRGRRCMLHYEFVAFCAEFLILPVKCIVHGTKVSGVIVVGQSSFKFRAREREQ